MDSSTANTATKMADEGNKALANIKNLAGSVGTGLNELGEDEKKGFNDAKAGVFAVKY